MLKVTNIVKDAIAIKVIVLLLFKFQLPNKP